MTANSKYLRLRFYALKPIFHIARRDRTRLVHSVTRRPATVIGIETNTFSRLLVSTRLVAGDVAWALITKKLSVSLKNNRDNFTSVCLKKNGKTSEKLSWTRFKIERMQHFNCMREQTLKIH